MQILAVLVDLLVDGGEPVAFTEVEHEINVPGEDIGDFQGNGVGDAGRLGGLKQRGLDRGRGGSYASVHRLTDKFSRKSILLAHHVQGLSLIHLARQFLDLAVVEVRHLDGVPGPQEVETLPNSRQSADRRQICLI